MPIVPVVEPDGDYIREVREHLELSRDQVVARMARHRHPKTLERIECGRDRRVSKIYLTELAEALGEPVGKFIKAEAA